VRHPELAGTTALLAPPPPQPGLPAKASARPIRVCFLIDQLSTAGTEAQLLALIRHLDPERVQPYLVLLKGDSEESQALEPAGCPILRLGVRSLHHLETLGKAARFVRFLRRERIDVVQVYFPDSTYFGVTLARLAGVRHVVRTRFSLGYWMTPLHRWLGRLHSRLTEATVSNCEACRQAAIAEDWAPPGAVSVLENGVELSQFRGIAPLDPAPAPGRPRHVGLVANLRPVKDPQLFLHAARKVVSSFPETRFHLAGEGDLRPELEHLIAELGLQEHVKLWGKVTDIPGFLARLDVAVLCSRSEGASNAILEYMAAGRAIVATAVGGTSQLIDEGINGLLAPPREPEALASALLQLLREPALAARLGNAARQRVRERYDARKRARRFEEFYARLLRKEVQ